jgi:pimeloyl-ACP methyl ester carboxylesterase
MTERIADALPEQYRLERELAAGGMATVYTARDVRHDRLVAIKVLRPDVCPAAGADRFLREIRIAAQLTHPHILPVIDSGESRGVLFYVMPYIDGETMRDRLSRAGELPVTESIRILRQLLDALEYAHGHGVVHRDIKPENVLLSGRHALVTDFGVAKALRDLSSSTAATSLMTAIGTTVGTPAYMAPEQVGGANVDHRADIYAVGVVAYEMLTGHLPFHGEIPQQMMWAHLFVPPEPIEKWRSTIPPRLANAVMKCLEKRPSDRWQSATDLLAEVEATAAAAEQPEAPASAEIANQLIEHRFMLTEGVCRKLKRATLDPRIIGDHLIYADNQVRSDVLVFFLHGLGLDHRDFGTVLERLPYRGLSPTLYGCEPDRSTRVSLSLADHIVILREWLREVADQSQASTIVMVGFSLGADMGFELLLTPVDEPAPPIDAFLSLECNLCLETCFVSRALAGIAADQPDVSIAELGRLGDAASSLDQWLNIHEYLVKVLRKFQNDIGVLQRAAADIVRPFREAPGFEVFARWFQGAREHVAALRLVFSDDSGSRAALARLKLENLDSGILGEEFTEAAITVSPNVDHFGLMAPDRVLRQIDELVADARAQRHLPDAARRPSSPRGSGTNPAS